MGLLQRMIWWYEATTLECKEANAYSHGTRAGLKCHHSHAHSILLRDDVRCICRTSLRARHHTPQCFTPFFSALRQTDLNIFNNRTNQVVPNS
eukprot:261969-Amphidinium_carterae.1